MIQKDLNANCVNSSCHIIPIMLVKGIQKSVSGPSRVHFHCSAQLNGAAFVVYAKTHKLYIHM